ncbi:hypothetical protein H4R34_005238 [Dimargaris verticillata]|uniref:Uncharacterized protein n=1 Tax=Dimargaris verticillata TaxID=2761393 RepID=A0A9W8E7B9_9FUNG|nr:hypothetical protein H4R34_005238 [Dimargaris verticillata]
MADGKPLDETLVAFVTMVSEAGADVMHVSISDSGSVCILEPPITNNSAEPSDDCGAIIQSWSTTYHETLQNKIRAVCGDEWFIEVSAFGADLVLRVCRAYY